MTYNLLQQTGWTLKPTADLFCIMYSVHVTTTTTQIKIKNTFIISQVPSHPFALPLAERHYSNFYYYTSVLSVPELHINGFTLYVLFFLTSFFSLTHFKILPQDSSNDKLHLSAICSFFKSSIPLHKYTTVCLSILLMMRSGPPTG